MGDIEDEKGGASLYQRALAIYNEGSDEWCIPNRGTKAWAKLEAIRDSLTTRSKPKAKRATAKPSAKRATAKPSAKRATFKRNVVKSSAKASDAPLREALANLATKRNRVITIPRTIVGRTDEPTKGEASTDKQDAGLAKLEAKLDKAITTATDAAALATATATASATATDAKLKKLTRKLKDATAATTAAATAVATAPVVATATPSDSERKLLKLANKLKLATDTAAAATITNNATADAKLSKLVADLRVANAQAAASASATDAKLFRLTAELERATRAALSTLPQTPARQSALSKVGKLAANITYYTATTVASGVATVAHGLAGAVGRKAVEYAASKVAPVPPMAIPMDIPEGKQEASPRPRRAKRPAVEAPRPPRAVSREPPAREAPPPPIPETQPPTQATPTQATRIIPEGKQEASPRPRKAKQPTSDIVPLMVLPDIIIKHRDYLDAAREVAKFNVEDMGRPLLTEHVRLRRDNAFKRYKREWKEASDKYRAERKNVSKTDYNKLTKSGEATADIIAKARANIKLFGEQGGNIRAKVEAWMSAPTITANSPRASAEEATEPEFEESAIVGSETEAPQSQPLESIDISGISSTQTTPSRTATQSRVDESRDIPDDPLARMEGIEVMGQGFREPLTPEEFVIQQMRRAVFGSDGLIHDI